ncbi:hypothetical protein BPAE_0416g00010 [Botrytis paeoniae]|uniref:Uncharacterized protein n=1 Tax=Botrytis paeoniae TaxID=278948 RepID=A0A4Z1EZF2_9HELO|nr:hypothetical protein BPAE_0416g00010 [Botrytis paeoniae]
MTRREQSQSGKRIKDKVATQESFDEQECSFASSTYETDRSMVEASPELAPTPPLRPLTQPRPLQPRQKAIVQHKAEPPRSRYKKRNVYNEEIVYDNPSTDLHRYSTKFNTSQGLSDRRQALDLLAEQAAIMYDHLPEESKWSAPRPVVPTITHAPTAPTLTAAAPAPIRFRPVSFGPIVSTRNTSVPMPTARMIPLYKSNIPTTPVPMKSDPSATPLNRSFTQPRPLIPRIPDWEINRRMRETAEEETAGPNAKQRSTSEPFPDI